MSIRARPPGVWQNSGLPPDSAIGFGASDWLEFAVAFLLVVGVLFSRPFIEPFAARFARKTGWCMVLLGLLPIGLRLLLLPNHPAPFPDVYDEFSHLLVADTLRHLRFANPPHSMHQFFETFFVLQQPTYSSIYPIGQGLVLTLGWAGVLLSIGAFCALCYWMLRAWTTPLWALVGGLLAVIEFGPLNQWMNTYWGGAVAAMAGCLVFGALLRLRDNGRIRDGALLGAGISLHLITRPFESVFLVLSAAVFLLPSARRLARPLVAAALAIVPAAAIILVHNKQITNSWTTLPYALSQYQYGVPTTLTVQLNPAPHVDMTPQQQMDYRMQRSFHGEGTDTMGNYFVRLEYRVRFFRFFLFAPLFLAVPGFLVTLRQFRFLWVAATLLAFALGSNFYPFFQPHYVAAISSLVVLVAVVGLAQLNREAAQIIVLVSFAFFGLWYGVHLFDNSEFSMAVRRYETWDLINHQNPERRRFVAEQLAQTPGKKLIFVRYLPQHIFQEEWVWNRADIDGSEVVWARDLGPSENEKLQHYYPDRTVWLLEPDSRPPRLSRYEPPPVVSPPSANPFITPQ